MIAPLTNVITDMPIAGARRIIQGVRIPYCSADGVIVDPSLGLFIVTASCVGGSTDCLRGRPGTTWTSYLFLISFGQLRVAKCWPMRRLFRVLGGRVNGKHGFLT